ncbi:MAG TPA: GGDEF domain-containing protein [Actinoplanes sp.]|nr:GGDEF domain-containing protein [Actinoplanes sp.]
MLVLAIHGPVPDDLLLDRITGRVNAALDRPGRAERRAGGFLVLLPDASGTEAARVLNRIRFAVRQPADIGGGRTARFGTSAGVAVRPAGSDTGLDVLITEADAALQREKRARTVA